MNISYLYYNHKEKIEKYLMNEKAFRYTYLICIYFSSFCFIEHFFQFLLNLCMYWGALLIIRRVFRPSSMKKIYSYQWFLLFLGSSTFTAILYFQDNFSTNLYLILHAAICFILFYGLHATERKKVVKKEIIKICSIFVKCNTVISVLGVLFLFTVVRIENYGYRMGMNGIRYTGFYTHPNIAAFVSVIGIVCCHIIWKYPSENNSKKEMVPNWFCKMSIILNILIVFLTDSNASLLFLIIYCMVFLFFKEYADKKKVLIKFLVKLLVFCIFLGGSSFFIRIICQNSMVIVIDFVQEIRPGEDEAVIIGREDRDDLSSGRVDSFTKAFLLLKQKPLLGVGKANIIEYGEYFLEEGFRYFDLHNGFLTILISTGTIGFTFFIIFIVNGIIKSIKSVLQIYNYEKTEQKLISIMTATICAYGAYAMLERTILFDVTFMVSIFWVCYGYYMTFITDRKEEE